MICSLPKKNFFFPFCKIAFSLSEHRGLHKFCNKLTESIEEALEFSLIFLQTFLCDYKIAVSCKSYAQHEIMQ